MPSVTVTNVGVITGSATKIADRTCDGLGGTVGGRIDFGAASGGSGSGYVFSIDGLNFCGCSGIWAPSGINQIKGSDIKEELIILHNVDIIGENMKERMEYDYTEDFRDIKNSDQ